MNVGRILAGAERRCARIVERVFGWSPRSYALRVRKGVPLDACFPIAGSLVVGRDAACEVVLVDPRVSRRHARISTAGEGIVFVDLDSSNGLFLNGTQQANGSLHVGDVLRLGDTELLVVSYASAS